MSEPLIKRYGDWIGVCRYYAESISQQVPTLNKDDFIAWMLQQADYSPSNYVKGMFGDAALYYHCYLINKKVRGDNNQHHLVLVCGKIGKGKSTLGLQICAMTDKEFNINKVCYVPPHLFRRLAVCQFGEANCIDEGGNFFKGRNAMTKIGRDISQAFQLVRDLKQVLVVCYDEPEKLDKDIIDKFDSMFIKLYNPEVKGDAQYKDYLGFSINALDKVKPLLKNKIPVTDNQITRLASWKGHNSIEIPQLNSFNEQVYRTEKRKFIRDHLTLLAEKWSPDYENVDAASKPANAPVTPADTPRHLVKTMKVTDYARLKGVNPEKIKFMIKKGKLKGEKFGGLWLIDVEQPEMA